MMNNNNNIIMDIKNILALFIIYILVVLYVQWSLCCIYAINVLINNMENNVFKDGIGV